MDGGAVLEEAGLQGNRVRRSLPLGRLPSGGICVEAAFGQLSSRRGSCREVASGNCLRGDGCVETAFVETAVAEGQGEKLLSGKLSSGRWLCGNCFRDGGQSVWGTIKAAPAGWIWEWVAAWKLLSGWRSVGGERSRRRLRADLGACGRVEMCGKGAQVRTSTARNGRRRTGKVQKGRKEVRFPAAEEVNWARDIAFCVSL